MDSQIQVNSLGKFKIYQSTEYLLAKHEDYEKYLQFDLLNENNISEVTKDSLSKINMSELSIHPHSILGVLIIDKWSLLLTVTQYEIVGNINNKEIYSVRGVDFVPITSESFVALTETKQYLDGIKLLFNTGFYYSFDYDLTSSMQTTKNPKSDTNFEESHDFYYNYNIKLVFEEAKINPIFTVKLIHGYVGIMNTELSGEEVRLVLISRRSHYMAGTLFNCKGIDVNGRTANFVETEQIMIIGHKTFSFVIYRGSQPLFLKTCRDNSGHVVVVDDEKSTEETLKAVYRHIDRITLKEKFNIFFINCLSDAVNNESLLNKSIQPNLFPSQTTAGTACRLIRFDFKQSFETGDFTSLENFSNQFIFLNQNSVISYYCEDSKFKSSIDQKGVVRVNCMNGLDRTNVMQASLCWKILETQVS